MNQEQNRILPARVLDWEQCLLGEHERDEVAEMQRLRRGPPPRVQVEFLPLLIQIQYVVKIPIKRRHTEIRQHRLTEKEKKRRYFAGVSVPVGEEEAPAEEDVRRAAGEARDAVDERGVEALAAELVHELVVVDAALPRRHLPWVHHLLLLLLHGVRSLLRRRHGPAKQISSLPCSPAARGD